MQFTDPCIQFQSYKALKILNQSNTKQGSQLKSIKINQICDVTYMACRFDVFNNSMNQYSEITY